MAAVWDELLRVKQLREEEAIKTMKERQLQLEQCQKNLAARIMEHNEYVKWCKKEERRLYKEVLARKVQVHNLNSLRDQIASFKEKQEQLATEVDKARSLVTEATAALAQARATRLGAYRTVKKHEAHKAIVDSEEKKEAERRSELEAEEFNRRTVH